MEELMQAGPGERVQAYLEMRLMCDIGLVGAPNAGKSSLLRALTASAPKVSHLMLRLTPQSNLWPWLKFNQPAPAVRGLLPHVRAHHKTSTGAVQYRIDNLCLLLQASSLASSFQAVCCVLSCVSN